MTPAERRALKAGKHERIRKLLNNLRATPPATMVKEQQTPAEVLDVPGSDRRSTGRETALPVVESAGPQLMGLRGGLGFQPKHQSHHCGRR